MSRARLSVQQLADECGETPPAVVDSLSRAGLPVRSPRSSLTRKHWTEARKVLGIWKPKTQPESKPKLKVKWTETSDETQSTTDKRDTRPFQWKNVGTIEPLVLLTPEQVNDIHWQVVRDFADSKDPVEPPGIRDVSLFHSAIARPATSFGNKPKYPTVSLAGSALFHSIIHNHPFHNGNKRTALVSLVTFLNEHGYVLTTDQDDLYDYVLRVADHKVVIKVDRDAYFSDREMLEIARWLQREMRRVERGERPLQYRRLKSILNEYKCKFEVLQGNKLNIHRGDLHTQVWYGGDGREATPSTIHKIRNDLELTEEHGIDSATFYRAEDRIPDFITHYRDLLARLAKV